MHQSVYNVFPDFTRAFEGYIEHMYLDVKGLVTIGFGCLIESRYSYINLPFVKYKDNTRANRTEILLDWHTVKANAQLAEQGALAARKFCKLYLTKESVYELMRKRLAENNECLRGVYPDFEKWPADAQLATHSMAWAMGPGFGKKFPRFAAAARKQDWAECAKQCIINSKGNPGVIPRNHTNVRLFQSAELNKNLPIEILRGYQL